MHTHTVQVAREAPRVESSCSMEPKSRKSQNGVVTDF